MPKDLSDTLRRAVAKCEISHLQLAIKTGVPDSSIGRFLNGGDIYLSSAAKLARVLGLELTATITPKKKTRPEKRHR